MKKAPGLLHTTVEKTRGTGECNPFREGKREGEVCNIYIQIYILCARSCILNSLTCVLSETEKERERERRRRKEREWCNGALRAPRFLFSSIGFLYTCTQPIVIYLSSVTHTYPSLQSCIYRYRLHTHTIQSNSSWIQKIIPSIFSCRAYGPIQKFSK